MLSPGLKTKLDQKNFTLSKSISTPMITQVKVVFAAHTYVSELFKSSIKYAHLLRHSTDVAFCTAIDTQAFLKLTQVCLHATTRYLGHSRNKGS